MKTGNKRAVLFLYEGDTEKEFYDKIFKMHLPKTFKAGIVKSNLKGCGSNVNNKVRGKIKRFLFETTKKGYDKINVIIAHDREGTRDECQSSLNISLLNKEFIKNKSRIVSINEILATQDLESWLFLDLEGIYVNLRVPTAEKNMNKFSNVEATNNRVLSQLFRRYNKHYQKGERVENFLNGLDLNKIYNTSHDLKEGIEFIKKICRVQSKRRKQHEKRI